VQTIEIEQLEQVFSHQRKNILFNFTSAFHPKALNMKKNGRSPGFPGLTGLLIPNIRNNGMEESKSLS
jgi:hypothetical protein